MQPTNERPAQPGAAEPVHYGPAYTSGRSFRARCEARQRWFRAERLGLSWGAHGHWLRAEDAAAGANFLLPEAFEAAQRRGSAGKGVGARTFENMLSSQAMAFNLFAPLAADLELGARVLAPLLPGLSRLCSVVIEHTPAAEIFGDQSAQGGVDCDVLIEAEVGSQRVVLVVETKLVEPNFSACGFRRPGRAARGQRVCPPEVAVADAPEACAYQHAKGYRYWSRARALGTLAALPAVGCPFGGPLWQLWVNHTLAHAEAERRGADEARLLVCAPVANVALGAAEQVGALQALLRRPESAGLLPLDTLIDRVAEVCGEGSRWARGLQERYGRV
jgi:hypothetical protein